MAHLCTEGNNLKNGNNWKITFHMYYIIIIKGKPKISGTRYLDRVE